MSKTILILAAGPLQLPAFHTARRMGLRTIGIDGDAKAIGLRYADMPLVADIRDPQAVLDAIKNHHIDGVIAVCTEVPLRSLGVVNQVRSLAGPRPDVIEGIIDKSIMRKKYETAGAPSPQSIACTSLEEAAAAYRRIGGRVILKPAVGMGSRGIYDFSDSSVLSVAFERSYADSKIGKVLVEEFVDGPEFSVEALSWAGRTEIIAVTEKITSGAPYWVEMGHTQPPNLTQTELLAIKDATQQGISSLGLDWTASHTEIKLTHKGPRLIETGGRLGGDFITTHLTPLSTGVDMVEGAIRLSLGEYPALDRFPRARGAAIRYFTPKPGLLEQDLDLDEIQALPGVEDVGCTFHAGDEIPAVRSSGDRAAWVIASGDTAAMAADIAESAVANLSTSAQISRH